jgi:hypothetical protein
MQAVGVVVDGIVEEAVVVQDAEGDVQQGAEEFVVAQSTGEEAHGTGEEGVLGTVDGTVEEGVEVEVQDAVVLLQEDADGPLP